jgi:hypothetical protein
MTAWERHGDTACRDKIMKGLECIKTFPFKIFSGTNYGFDPDTCELFYIGESAAGGSHLAICMGEPQIYFELADLLLDPEWDTMLADYGEFYHLSSEEKQEYSKGLISGRGWGHAFMAAAMGAYAAKYKNKPELAEKMWAILKEDMERVGFTNVPLDNFSTDFVKTQMPHLSTNFAAQWCVNVITMMGL